MLSLRKSTFFIASVRTLTRSVLISCAFALPTVAQASEQAKEIPTESFTQAGKAYFSRAADKLVDSVSGRSESLINQAMELIGVRYRWNMDIPQSGLDGSGFVAYVFKDKLSFLIPRKSSQMSKVGKSINRDDLQPGDLVFFNTMRMTFSHVGIYVGENKFIHSPSKGANIRVDDMTSVYWDKRFDGARRLDGSDEFSEQERKNLLNEMKKFKKQSQMY
jgi:cell wall-associated NlpC family hydrolase